MPSAAPATEARKMSSVCIASLKPASRAPSCALAGMRQLAKRSVASGCGAITCRCSESSSPGRSASTMKAVMPRVPWAMSVLANTQ